MADVFISYSRQEIDFVRLLVAAFHQHSYETWVDWKDIPPTAIFLDEIYAGIEEASTFIFVLSPDSIVSEMCLKEVAHAVEFKKRMIPLLYRPVNGKQVPIALRELEWITFYGKVTSDAPFQELLSALELDLGYWHQAGQLLKRARDWERKKRSASILLRGSELREAEHWLQEGTNKEPHPIILQSQFIRASRRSARTRFVLSIMVLVVLLGLGGMGTLWSFLHTTNLTLVTNANDNGPGSLRQAITSAQSGGIITFDASLMGKTIHLTTNNLDLFKNLTIRGLGANHLSISSGSAGYQVRVYPSVTVTISGMGFKNSQPKDQTGLPPWLGSGILSGIIANSGTLTLTNCIVSGINAPETSGGGIENAGTLTLTNSTVSNNTSQDGGGIENDGTLTLINSTVSHNTAYSPKRGVGSGGTGSGGGISNISGNVTLINSTVSNNTASAIRDDVGGGGGISSSGGNVTLINSTISGNRASYQGIAVLHNWDGSGGGIEILMGSKLSIKSSTISNNSASFQGGGIYTDSDVTLINSTISGNTASSDGGGMVIAGNNADISFCTVYNNTSQKSGGGISAEGGDIGNSQSYVQMRNSLIAGNHAALNLDLAGNFTSNGYNLIQNVSGAAIITAPSDVIGMSPKVGPLENNGGQTWTHALLPGSPALDQIPLEACHVDNVVTDQRGVKRPQGPKCDIGAYEASP